MDSQILWSPGVTLESIEKQVILTAFRFYRGNKTATANSLGIAVRTLDNKLDIYKTNVKTEQERIDNERIERQLFLERARGKHTPDNIFTGHPEQSNAPAAVANQGQKTSDVHSPDARVHVEPASNPKPQQTMPVSERKEVQGLPPKHSPQGSQSRRR